ncbi:MAG: flippase-like domain-containing protein [Magnetococcales bacterium]|nr:flippase-like domain-containing protein [Magnetococcales bacterium]MBF0157795.1 flippase-like domain-containing protein [Magnetococcales bacterium]
MRDSYRRWLVHLAKLAVAALIVIFLMRGDRLDLQATTSLFAETKTVVISLLLVVIGLLLTGLRWWLLMNCQEIGLPLRTVANITFIGMFFGNILPGGAWSGDALRMAIVGRATRDKLEAGVLSIFVDRLMGIYSVFLIGLVALVVTLAGNGAPGLWENPSVRYLAYASAIVVVMVPVSALLVLWGGRRSTRLRHWLRTTTRFRWLARLVDSILRSIHLYRKNLRQVALAFFICLVAQTLVVFSLVMVAWAMGFTQLSAGSYYFAGSWTSLVNALPATPGGLGIGEAAFDQICHWLDTSSPGVAYGSVFLGFRIILYAGALPGLPGLFFYNRQSNRQSKPTP